MRRFAALSLMLVAHEARAYEFTKTRQTTEHYDAATIEYDVAFTVGDSEGELFSASVRRAFDSWGRALKGRIVPIYRGPKSGALCTVEKVATGVDRVVAQTPRLVDDVSGLISDFDIELNAREFRFGDASLDRGAFDTESVVVHEVGHGIGFAHSCGDPTPSCFDSPPQRLLDAVMFPTLAVGTVRRNLGEDELLGLADHYAVSATITAPLPRALEVDCAAREVALTGDFFPATPRVEARYSTGAHEPVAIRAEGNRVVIEGIAAGTRVDFLVHDDAAHTYGSLVDVIFPDPCAPPAPDGGTVPPPLVEDGCGCTSAGRQTGSTFAMMLLVLALGLARRRALLVLAVCALPSADAFAFKCSRVGSDFGPSLVWQQRSIPWWANNVFSDDLTPDQAREELKLSFQAWEDVDCSDITLPFQGEEAGLNAGFNENGDNKNVVVFIEANWKYDPTVIAVTTNAFDTRNGQIYDSDIEINGQHFRFSVVDEKACAIGDGRMDLRNALTHEVGHVLGLDHPPNTPRYAETTMFASAPPCETKKRTLHQDDIDGLCAIYPAGMVTEQCYPPNGPSFALVESNDGFGGCRGSNTREASGLGLIALALVGIISLMRRSVSPRTDRTT